MAHDHSRSGEHHEQGEGTVSRPERLLKLFEFWLHHNEEHARSYRDWAGRAREMGLDEVGRILESLADDTLLANQNLERAAALLKDDRPRIDSPKRV